MPVPPAIAISIALTGWSARYAEIDQVEAWYHGIQYQVSGPWYREHAWECEFDVAGAYVPLAKRQPYDFGIGKAMVDQSTGFLFDEGRFPQLLADGEGDSKPAAAWMRALSEHVKLRVRMLEAARIGGRARSVFVYFKLVDGEPILDTHSGKLCTPHFARDGKTLTLVRKQYKARGADLVGLGYHDLKADKLYWFRHDFTATAELAYFPVEVQPGPNPPAFQVDNERSFPHDLGFVSGVWMVNMMRAESSFDGISMFDSLPVQNAIHLCNDALSRAHRATGNACDPQFALELDTKADAAPVDPSSIKDQVKGGVWTMPGKLNLLEAQGKGPETAREQFGVYRKLAADASGWPEVDPSSISDKAQSAEALRVLNMAAIGFASLLRVSYGTDGLVPLLKVMLRVVKHYAGSPMNVEAYDDAGKPIDASTIPDKPRVRLEWGEWFAPTAADRQAIITAAALGVSSGLLSQETAVSFVARLFGRDGAEELKLILAEKAAREQEAMRQHVDMANALDQVGQEGGGPPQQ